MFSLIKSGMSSAMHELSVVSNNISNANSIGFKKSLVSYSNLGDDFNSEAVSRTQVGQGAIINATRHSDAQGSILNTQSKTDLALIGNGYFTLKSPKDDSVSFTRNGSFEIDEQGFLRSNENCFILGAPALEGEYVNLDTELDNLSPIQIPLVQDGVSMTDLKIFGDGKIGVEFGSAEIVPIATLALGVFSNPVGLKGKGNGRFVQSDESGILSIGAPTDRGFATLQAGGLERSNVDITDELTNMIKAQQQFNGSARLMQTNSEMVERLTR